MSEVTAEPTADHDSIEHDNTDSADNNDQAPPVALTDDAADPAQDEPEAAGPETEVDAKPSVASRVIDSLGLPGPGTQIKVGSTGFTVPTGYLYYGGLGVLAVVGAIEWPIALAVGAGTYVVTRIVKRSPSKDRASADAETEETPV
jgi:hypothetical protein